MKFFSNHYIHILIFKDSFLRIRVENLENNQRVFLNILSLFLGSHFEIIPKIEDKKPLLPFVVRRLKTLVY